MKLPLRILIAEDSVINQRVTLKILERLGYCADVVANGLEALDAIDRQHYDVVLMDLQMPAMDGLEASRRICQQTPPAHRPRIIAMTAGDRQDDRERCLKAGMDDYVSKPVKFSELQAALARSQPGVPELPYLIDPALPIINMARISLLRELEDEHDPELVNELIELFFATVSGRITELKEAGLQQDLMQLHYLSHTLKGNCANIGADRLAALAERLEQSARLNQLAAIIELLPAIEAEFALVQTALKVIQQGE